MTAHIFRVDDLEGIVEDFDWPFAQDRAAEINRHWQQLTRRQPRLFNGTIFLACNWSLENAKDRRVYRVRLFQTEYKTFLAWRDFGFPDTAIANCFATPALAGSDGVFVLGEMASHTANAGQVYFPCGTPDPADLLSSRRLDFAGSVLRELEEETGLNPSGVTAKPGWTIIDEWPRLAFVKDAVATLPGATVAAQVRSHIANDSDPELSGVYLAAGPKDIRADVMPGYITQFLHSRFDQPAG